MRRQKRKPRYGRIAIAFMFCAVVVYLLISRGFKSPIKILSADERFVKDLINKYDNLNDVEAVASLEKIFSNIDDYPDQYLDLLKRNEETIGFVADYIDGIPAMANTSNGVASGEIPHFVQWDKRWGYSEYVDAPIAINGCGPTSLAMVVAGLTGRIDINPLTVAEFSADRGFYVENVGTDWELMTAGAAYFGLNVKELSLSETTIKAALKDGSFIIASMRPGTFTDVGHFIVLVGVDSDGKILVHDPNSYIKSSQAWDFEVFENEARNFWSFSSY